MPFGCAAFTRSGAVALLLLLASVAPAAGQTTNLELFQELAVECLGELPAGVDSLVITSPDRMPFVRSALVSHWQEDGRAVFLSDSVLAVPNLTYSIDEASVRYDRRGRRLARRIHLDLRYTLLNGMGRVLADDRCSGFREDVIARSSVDRVQHEAYPETVGALPQGGWFRRIVEPVVLTAAGAVVVYLFFTIRSGGNGES